MPEPVFMKLGMHIMGTEPISTAYFINPSQSVLCACMCTPPIVAKQRLDQVYPTIPCSVNTFPPQRIHATIGEVLRASFSVRSLSYQRRVCGSVYPPVVARWQLRSCGNEQFLEASFSMRTVSYQMRRRLFFSKNFLFCISNYSSISYIKHSVSEMEFVSAMIHTWQWTYSEGPIGVAAAPLRRNRSSFRKVTFFR
jgi:hypothetical protein